MRGVYTGSVLHTVVSAATNMWTLTAPTNCVIEIYEASIKNLTNETNEQLQYGMFRATTAGVGTATQITLKKTESLDSAAPTISGVSCLVKSYATTQPILEADPVDPDGGSSLAGYLYDPSPETRYVLEGQGILTLRIVTATFAAIDALATLKFRIIG